MFNRVFFGRNDNILSIFCQLIAEIELQTERNVSRVAKLAELFTVTKVHYLAELQTLLNYLLLQIKSK
jgi:hypothetical protein